MKIKQLIVIVLFVGLSVALSLAKEPARDISAQQTDEIETEDDSVVAAAEELPAVTISDYDAIMQDVERESGIDWRLLSAIAYAESRFNDDLVSSRGAVGVMQVMPAIGNSYGMSDEELSLPENNIRAAAYLLRDIESAIKLPEGLPESDRLGILLASYNSGMGHVSDARRLAVELGGSKNSWGDVSDCLKLKADPEYYERSVVKYGRFNSGSHTSAYVANVMKLYDKYCRMTEHRI